jgi:hypothetical protein
VTPTCDKSCVLSFSATGSCSFLSRRDNAHTSFPVLSWDHSLLKRLSRSNFITLLLLRIESLPGL